MNWQTDAERIKADFDRDGCVAIRGFLSLEEVQDVLANVERYLREVSPTLPPEEHFYEIKGRPETLKYIKSMSAHDEYFRDLANSEKFIKLAELLLEDDIVCQDMSMFNKPPRVGEETPAHQDGFYFMLEPNEALTVWLALDVVDEENGCVRYVKGSHRRGMRDHRRTNTLGFSQGMSDYSPEDAAQEIALHAQPGDALIHHSMTIHRAEPNRSDRPRRALGFVYYAARAKQDKAAIDEYQKTLYRDLAEAEKI